MRGPGFWNMGLSLSKGFRIGERYNLQFCADTLNVFNRVILTNPIQDLTRFDFGLIRTVESARTMQLALRFHF